MPQSLNESNTKIPTSDRGKPSALQVWEHHIHAFVELCPESRTDTLTPGDQLNEELIGITVGVKDIIDVKGIPTRNGSDACCHAQPATEDAIVVASLRCAGAVIVGKTTTTEFAFTDPTNCRNPYDLTRTPGGSSSGSGAAVAAGIVDMALGTQTAGSLCRPAAYCGVVGFKPTHGVLSTTGVTSLAESFDTVGIIARSVNIARKGFTVMANPATHASNNKPEVVSALLPTQAVATDETLSAFHAASHALGQQGINVKELAIKSHIGDIVSAHRTVMNAEAAQAHRQLLHPDYVSLLRPKFRSALEAGTKVSATELEQARGLLSLAKADFWLQLTGIDCVLTLPVPDAAPLMDGTTGFQDWLTPWTVFGGPLICLPWGLDSLGRPKSIMLAAHPGHDMQVLAIAQRLEKLAPLLPRPTAPPNQGLRNRN